MPANFDLDWAEPEKLRVAAEWLDRICRSELVRVDAHRGSDPPPYHVHLYLRDDDTVDGIGAYAGVAWRDNRWPTEGEMLEELERWRPGVNFVVKYWVG